MSDSIKVGTTVKVSENGAEAVVIKPVADQMPWCENVEFPDGSTAILRREPMVVVKGPAKASKPAPAVLSPEDAPPAVADDPGAPL